MDKYLNDLVEISKFYGSNKDFVIAGGGNTSFKNNEKLWVKGSGTSMATISIEGFAVLDRAKLKVVQTKNYSQDTQIREEEVKTDLHISCLPESKVRPSVETSMHDIINYSFVVHTHPTRVNALTCSKEAKQASQKLFGDSALFIEYTDPGYILFMEVFKQLEAWRKNHDKDPNIIFLENHGVFVAANSIDEIKKIYEDIDSKIKGVIGSQSEYTAVKVPENITEILPALRMIFSEEDVKLAQIRNNSLIQNFISSSSAFSNIELPFTPDQIVYCKARPIFIDAETPEAIIAECQQKISKYKSDNGYMPKVVGIKNYGIAAFEDSSKSVETVLDVFEDLIKIADLSKHFGGPQHMTENAIAFIENWEVENYRRKVSKSAGGAGKAENKIIIVTGGAQGFGGGVAEDLFSEGANVVIADLMEDKGQEMAAKLNQSATKNKAIACRVDVTNAESLQALIYETVKTFGGLDAFISNAGILFAGGIDEMSFEVFEKVTRVNYSAYFMCVKHATPVLKKQSQYRKDYYSDIIQINSKSGLKGSKKNFAYAGGKFGGIGLTQSFALELMPDRIKVNSICPGNFFEGPLWSDPNNGLFVQYLNTGKVPGAKTIEDVKAYYEAQVPAGRGCRVKDVAKAIYYVMDQEYETGQAIPVTGGQEMLN